MSDIKGIKISQNVINSINVYIQKLSAGCQECTNVLQSVFNSDIACRLWCRVSQHGKTPKI